MNPLKSVQWLHENLNNSNLIILEANLKTSVNKENPVLDQHIPNALSFDISNVFSDTLSTLPNMMPSEHHFTAEVQKLGINKDSIIIVYDAIGVYCSPRAWWLFLTMKHTNVYVLDGGLPEWIQNGFSTCSLLKTPNKKGNFTAHYQPQFISNRFDILKNLGTKNKTIIDARSSDRFAGITPDSRKNARAGHIPGSKNIYFENVLNGNLLKSKEELKRIFDDVISGDDPLIFSCGSGITACIDALAATIIGRTNLSIYDGSWSEWGILHELPIEGKP